MIAITLLMTLVVGDAQMGDAKRLYEAGEQAYEQGRYRVAIDAFEESYRLAPRAATAFSGAQAHRLQYFIDGDLKGLERAIELYRAYLEIEPTGSRREHAAQHLATLVPVLDRLRREGAGDVGTRSPERPRTQVIVSCRTPKASVRVDGGSPEAAPAAFEVEPGKHRIEVEAEEYLPQTLETVAVQGSVVALNVALDPRPGLLRVRAPSGAQLAIDGRPVGPSALHHPVELPAGHHVVAVTARGRRPFVRELELGRGGQADLAVSLEPTTQRWFSYAMFAVGGALLVGTAVPWGMALGKQSSAVELERRLETGPSLTNEEAARYRSLQAERDSLVRIGAVTVSIGAAAAALGLVLWLVDKPEAPSTMVTPTIGERGAGLAFTRSF